MRKKITVKDVKFALKGSNLIKDKKLKVEARNRVVIAYAVFLLRQALWDQFFNIPCYSVEDLARCKMT